MLLTGQIVARLAIVALSPLAGVAMARLARRFKGAERISGAWMAAGAVGIAITSIAWATSAAGLGLALTLGLGLGLLALVAVDVTALRLPDLITLPLAVAGLGVSGLAPGGLVPADLTQRLLGVGLGFGAMIAVDALYVRWRGRHGLGMGDAKLFAAAGAWLGVSALPIVLLLACAGGMAWVALRMALTGRRALQERVPFGLPLACAFWTVWLLG